MWLNGDRELPAPDLMARMETQVVNTAARRIGEKGNSTRIETLRFPPGAQSGRNMHFKQCAGLKGSMLRAYQCSAGAILEQELSAALVANTGERAAWRETPCWSMERIRKLRPQCGRRRNG